MRTARKCRAVKFPPFRLSYKPAGVPGTHLEEISITVDEYEAIRLVDYEELEHQEAADKMNISRPTLTRLVKRARNKIAIFLVECRKLDIHGGNFHFENDIAQCQDCGAFIYHEIDLQTSKCPHCGSENIISLAEKLGHGDCCREQKQVIKDSLERIEKSEE